MIRAIARPDYKTFGVEITLVKQYTEDSSPVEVLHLEAGSDGTVTDGKWEKHHPGAEVTPTLILDDDLARPLLDALNQHYHGVDDARALRRDLDGERQRTDTLIGLLGAVAGKLAEAQP